jgi:hypothetical protein
MKNREKKPMNGAQQPTDNIRMGAEPCDGGYWSYYERSPGRIPETPISDLLKWILQQVSLGHLEGVVDDKGDVISLTIGQEAPFGSDEASSIEEARRCAAQSQFSLNIAGLIAEAREHGTSTDSADLVKKCWDTASSSAHRRMEIHYSLVLCQLLARVSKKLPKLELLPIIDTAPPETRDYLAEATRCYLFKLDRACIALCRACLEDTLKSVLTTEMQNEWRQEMAVNKKNEGSPNPMLALIAVCARHGVLGKYKNDADYIRQKANAILHRTEAIKGDIAAQVLHKTRSILGFVYA